MRDDDDDDDDDDTWPTDGVGAHRPQQPLRLIALPRAGVDLHVAEALAQQHAKRRVLRVHAEKALLPTDDGGRAGA